MAVAVKSGRPYQPPLTEHGVPHGCALPARLAAAVQRAITSCPTDRPSAGGWGGWGRGDHGVAHGAWCPTGTSRSWGWARPPATCQPCCASQSLPATQTASWSVSNDQVGHPTSLRRKSSRVSQETPLQWGRKHTSQWPALRSCLLGLPTCHADTESRYRYVRLRVAVRRWDPHPRARGACMI